MTLELPTRKPGQVGRERILPVLIEIRDLLRSMDVRLTLLEGRPAKVTIREWKPNHRRLVDGGTPILKQRKNVKKIRAELAKAPIAVIKRIAK